MKKIAVVLSGCGFLDGSEITEVTSTLICLSEQGAQYQCFAPDQDFSTTNHLISKPTDSQRNALIEAARICRGQIQSLAKLNTSEFDAIIFPGGLGVTLNLSSWDQKGAQSSVLPEVENIIKEFHQQSKPIGATSIAPILIAKTLGSKKPCLTIGDDTTTIQEIEKTGADHEICPVNDYITDRENKIITTPTYMYEATPHEIFIGIRGLIKELFEMA